MSTKTTEGRVRDLESFAFRTGEDMAEIKNRLTAVEADAAYTRKGVDLLLDHYGISRPENAQDPS